VVVGVVVGAVVGGGVVVGVVVVGGGTVVVTHDPVDMDRLTGVEGATVFPGAGLCAATVPAW